jgi:transposase-like protein
MICPKCSSDKNRKNGVILKTGFKKFQRVQCLVCGCNYQGEIIPKKII